MAFKIRGGRGSAPDDPEALLRDLRKKTIPGILSHQADLIRSYLGDPLKHPDVALQLPTGSGKTLVGLLIGEWRRRKFGERVVYLCPTNQLVNQVANHATTKYGMDVHAFTGSKLDYDPRATADWQNADAIAITNYSSLFNVKPFFDAPNLIILDDAHSAENYISAYWSLLIDRSVRENESAFSAVMGVLMPLMSPSDQARLAAKTKEEGDGAWVDKIPTPMLQPALPELTSLLDEHTEGIDLGYQWRVIRDSLSACQVYVSRRAILIRPLIPPSSTHPPFAKAKQRLYMSATLGAGGDLERVTGRSPIVRIPVPAGWDKQGIGRRFFVFPKRSLDEDDTKSFVVSATQLAGRALYLTPDEFSATNVSKMVTDEIGCAVFSAREIEESKDPFVKCDAAVAVVANRYDGIDLVDEDCRLLFIDALPRGANLQERFLVSRVGAQLLLDDRILTRIVQGFGRCTRSPNDFAAVVILGETLHRYLLTRERREFFHPEIQAEMEFGLDQSKDTTGVKLLKDIEHFLAQDTDWDEADEAIVDLRADMKKKELPAAGELSASVQSELSYQYAMWAGDYAGALEHCRAVLGKIRHPELRGYRALWLYLAASAAALATEHRQLDGEKAARDYFIEAQHAAPSLRWLVNLRNPKTPLPAPVPTSDGVFALVERLEPVLEGLGMAHDRKYDSEEAEILEALLQDDDGKLFERGHQRLGVLLGFDAGRSTDTAAPDPWWIVDQNLCFVFEDHAEGNEDTVFSPGKARQAASHPEWIRHNLRLAENAVVIPVLITPTTKAEEGAMPHLKKVRYWRLADFRDWAKSALRTIRRVRRDYPGPGNLGWRDEAGKLLRAAKIGPAEFDKMLKQTAFDAMTSNIGG